MQLKDCISMVCDRTQFALLLSLTCGMMHQVDLSDVSLQHMHSHEG